MPALDHALDCAIRALDDDLTKPAEVISRARVGALVQAIGELSPRDEDSSEFDAVLRLVRACYSTARSKDALPIVGALEGYAERSQSTTLRRRAYAVSGLVAVDAGDVVGGLESHIKSLQMAAECANALEVSRSWNNIGLAFGVAGCHLIAVRCYLRALVYASSLSDPVHPRYAAYANLACSHYHLGNMSDGIDCGQRAIDLLLPEYAAGDPQSTIILHRDLVRILVALRRSEHVEPHLRAMSELVARAPSPRSVIAVETARAAYELAIGSTDIALTRARRALAMARGVPAALPDAMLFAIQTEATAGHDELARERMSELSELIYRTEIERVRSCVELTALIERTPSSGPMAQESHLSTQPKDTPRRRSQPESWHVLQRLAVAAVLPMDRSGAHGTRVGVLSRMLALACGLRPLEALEIGEAAQLHDIGLTAIPKSILAKPGALSDDERQIVRRHTEAGADILCDDGTGRMLLARQIAQYHHARWDGNGYPERIAGRFIPLPARICAIADAFDVMVCGLRRPRRISIVDALDAIRSEAGAQFDPKLVKHFEAVLSSHSADYGIELTSANAGLRAFHGLIESLQMDRGFI